MKNLLLVHSLGKTWSPQEVVVVADRSPLMRLKMATIRDAALRRITTNAKRTLMFSPLSFHLSPLQAKILVTVEIRYVD